MLEMLYDYMESILNNEKKDFYSIDKHVINGSTITVTFTYVDKQGNDQTEEKDVNMFEILGFVYDKVTDIKSDIEN